MKTRLEHHLACRYDPAERAAWSYSLTARSRASEAARLLHTVELGDEIRWLVLYQDWTILYDVERKAYEAWNLVREEHNKRIYQMWLAHKAHEEEREAQAYLIRLEMEG